MKIYEQAKDLHVRKTVIYGNTTNSKLYVNSGKTTEASHDEVVDAFEKGMLLVSVGDNMYSPVAISVASSTKTLVCVNYASSALAAVTFTIAAAE